VASELADDSGMSGVRDRRLVLHDANLTKHGQQPLQRLRIASANPLLPTAKTQKAIHNLAIQILDVNVFPIQPSAKISDHDDLLPDGVVSIALIDYSSRIGVEVFIQRPLAQSFNRT
jgi:hypothetical protein